jgi:predicted permease
VAVLSLALGIGLNSAIFSAVDSILLRPLAVRDLDRTVIVSHSSPGNADGGTSFRAYQHYRDRSETFSNVVAFGGARPLSLVDGDRRDTVYAELVTADFFAMADIRMRLGRPFGEDVDRVSDPPFVALLSSGLWQRRFGSDADIAGKTVTMNGRPFIVLGVIDAGFGGFDSEVVVDLWIPMASWAHLMSEPGRLTGDEHWMTTIALLRSGVTLEQAQAAMSVAGPAVHPTPGMQTNVRSARQRSLAVVETLAIGASAFAVGLLVLTLACTNVANLLIARAAARQREMAVRMALGASRGRLVRLWLIECLLLCLAAGSVGLLFAWWILGVAQGFRPPTLLGLPEAGALPVAFQLDARVSVFTVGLSSATALIVGLLSGFQAASFRMMQFMKSDRATDRRFAPGFNVRSSVIALQMALSLTLLIPCGLFVRTWLAASSVEPGFSAERVLLLPIAADQGGVRVQKPAGFDLQLADRVAALAGVASATVMDPVPLWFAGAFAHFSAEGPQAPSAPQRIGHSRIGLRYFDTMRIPLLAGRDFAAADNATAPKVAIVSETLARRFWPSGDAVGRRLRNRDDVIQVVGIAKDSKYEMLGEAPQPWLYRPLAQVPSTNLTLSLAVRTTADPLLLRASVEREVRSLVPSWPVFQFRTLDEGLELQRRLPRIGATLLGVLGAFGALLASVGLYGVMAFVVRQRTREIGIRLALGAPRPSVIALVIRQGMAVCLAGMAAGFGITLAVSRFLQSLLYGISAADPATYAVVSLLLAGTALAACYLPARRITEANTFEALRQE